MEREIFSIRCYGKGELARIYFPTLSQQAASRKMRRWICRCKELYHALEESSYSWACKTYSAREVRLIVKYLGEP